MHRSRIGVILIDHPPETYDAAAAFWAAAVGKPRTAADGPPSADPYEEIGTIGDARLELQRTGAGTAPRIHVDIETDDVPAETARLVALGATVVTQHEKYTILNDPGGLFVCVVPVQTAAFVSEAVTWP